MKLVSSLSTLLLYAQLVALSLLNQAIAAPGCDTAPEVCIETLHVLSIPGLRERRYTSRFELLEPVSGSDNHAFMVAYQSDGLRLYSRLDLPVAPAPAGYPLVALAPGWISREQAQTWDFGSTDSTVNSVREALLASNIAVLTVGYRGRGQVDDVPAEGMAYRDAWGNGSYLSPMFYAIDLLNALAGLSTLQEIDWSRWLPKSHPSPEFDLARVSLWGHSQGGDVASTALAVIGGNQGFPQPLLAASIWSGNIPDRFTQANTFGPMGSTLQAFMSGDGTWTGSAIGRAGEVNPDFIFAWPADWIGTVDTASESWTWQAQQWSTPTVAEALRAKYTEMYDTLNQHVRGLSGLKFSLEIDTSGRTSVVHADGVMEQMMQIGAFHHAHRITTPVALHISDRDYYSLPDWNHEFARRVIAAGGLAEIYIYPGNNHALRRSEQTWFSPEGTTDGAPVALAADIRRFRGQTADN